jgi:hypothetical protein
MDLCKLQTKFSIFITTELSLIQDSLWDNNLQQSLRNCILYINGITTLYTATKIQLLDPDYAWNADIGEVTFQPLYS